MGDVGTTLLTNVWCKLEPRIIREIQRGEREEGEKKKERKRRQAVTAPLLPVPDQASQHQIQH